MIWGDFGGGRVTRHLNLYNSSWDFGFLAKYFEIFSFSCISLNFLFDFSKISQFSPFHKVFGFFPQFQIFYCSLLTLYFSWYWRFLSLLSFLSNILRLNRLNLNSSHISSPSRFQILRHLTEIPRKLQKNQKNLKTHPKSPNLPLSICFRKFILNTFNHHVQLQRREIILPLKLEKEIKKVNFTSK